MSASRHHIGPKLNPYLLPQRNLARMHITVPEGQGAEPGPQPSQNLYISGLTDTMVNPTYSGLTAYSTFSGNWGTAGTWSTQAVPTSGAKVVISPGHTVVYDVSGDAIMTAVSVLSGATLTWSPTTNTRLTVVTLCNHPNGNLYVGMSGTPIASGFTAEIKIADVPLNSGEDPFQFWNGLVSWGKTRIFGQEKTSKPWRLSAVVTSGATSLTFSGAPTNWWVGDTLIVPDSRRLAGADSSPGGALPWENGYQHASETGVIASGQTAAQVFLSGPMTYAHPGFTDISGNIAVYPHAGNLTRNVKVYSANPSGVRGHCLFVDYADVKIRGAEFHNLARTKVDEYLDNTAGTYGAITHYGTNQVGRYGVHMHHVQRRADDPVVFEFVGNSIWSTFNPQKWGIVAHDSPYGVINENVIYNVKGWGIGTEQGTEVGLTVNDNFIVKSRGSVGAVGLASPDSRGTSDIGFEGFGVWFRSTPILTFQNNVIADCLGGLGCFSTTLAESITVAAGPLSTDGTMAINPYKVGWSGFNNNEVYGGGMVDGFTYWDGGARGNYPQSGVPYDINDFCCWHVNAKGYSNYRVGRFNFNSPRFYGHFDHMYLGNGATAFYGADYVAEELVIKSGIIQGFPTGLVVSSQGSIQTVTDTIMACYIGVAVPTRWGTAAPINNRDRNVYLNNVLYWPLLSGNNNLYSGKCAIAMAGHNLGAGNTSLINNDRIYVSGHNRVSGANYLLYFYEAGRDEIVPQTQPSGAAVPPDGYPNVIGSPVSGLTNIQCLSGNVNALASGICRMNRLPPAAPDSVSGILGLVEVI